MKSEVALQVRQALTIFLSTVLLFLVFLNRPARLIFDEKFYVTSARGILATGRDENFQHPPLAKEMIAGSIALLGDNPWGWRAASAAMGALTLVSIYLLMSLFVNSSFAVAAVIFVFANGLFFTLSRLGLLEIFSLGFTMMAITALFYQLYRSEPDQRRLLQVSAILFGLAIAAKWSAAVPFVVCVVGGVLTRKISWRQWILYFVRAALFYILPFFLLSSMGFGSVIELHKAMWLFHNPDVFQSAAAFENASPWWDWAFRIQPMWFAVLPNEANEHGKFLGVMIFGNPFVIWVGWGALVFCAWRAFRRGAEALRWLVTLALAPYLVWAVVQRPATYFYYFLPTSVFLALALVFAVDQLVKRGRVDARRARLGLGVWAGLAVIWFFYHWPLMTGVELTATEFQQWWPWVRF